MSYSRLSVIRSLQLIAALSSGNLPHHLQAVPFLMLVADAESPGVRVFTPIADNGPLDNDPTSGSISYNRTIGLHAGTFTGTSRLSAVADPSTSAQPLMSVS